MSNTLKIKQVVRFKCPQCGSEKSTRLQADRCLSKCLSIYQAQIDAETQRQNNLIRSNQLRLSLAKFTDVAKAIENEVAQRWNAIMTFSTIEAKFGLLNDLTYRSIVQVDKDDPTKFLGWRVRMEGVWSNSGSFKDRHGDPGSFYDLFTYNAEHSIQGFNVGCGGGGNHNFGYTVYMFLNDFPLLKQQYLEFQNLQNQEAVHNINVKNQAIQVQTECLAQTNKNLELQKLKSNIKQLDQIRSILMDQGQDVINQIEQTIDQNKQVLFPIATKDFDSTTLDRYNKLKQSFPESRF